MEDILQTFVYPDSRAQFFLLLTKAGVELGTAISTSDTTQSLNFWSYAVNPAEKKATDTLTVPLTGDS